MCNFYIFFREDMLLVNIFMIAYFLYCLLYGREKESRISKYCVLFSTLFYWFFFLLSYFISNRGIREIAKFILIPTIAAFVLLLPIKLETKIRRSILLFLVCYVFFLCSIIIWHYFSFM